MEPPPRWFPPLCAALFVGLRLLCFPLGSHYYGDAVMRTHYAALWAANPHVYRHAGELQEVAPLQPYVIGSLLWLWRQFPGVSWEAGLEVVSRVPSLLAGLALGWVLVKLGEELAESTAGPWTAPMALLLGAAALLRGAGATAVKSVLLLPVSMQPFPLRRSLVVFESVGAAAVSEQFAEP